MWEIKHLDNCNSHLCMSLQDAMMTFCHPTKSKFDLFHSVDKSRQEHCHILTIPKLAGSYAHAMIWHFYPTSSGSLLNRKGITLHQQLQSGSNCPCILVPPMLTWIHKKIAIRIPVTKFWILPIQTWMTCTGVGPQPTVTKMEKKTKSHLTICFLQPKLQPAKKESSKVSLDIFSFQWHIG